jgi:hypothetical protein
MQIRSLRLTDIAESLKLSIEQGRRNYVVFFLAGLIFGAAGWLVSVVGLAGVLSVVMDTLFAVGALYAAQMLAKGERQPTVADFFVSFKNTAILKRFVSSVVLQLLVVVVLVSASVGVVVLLVRTWVDVYGMNASELRQQPLALGLVTVAVTLLVTAPFFHFNFLLALQTQKWSQLFGASLKGFLKNWHWHLVWILVLVGLTAAMTTCAGLVAPEFGSPKQAFALKIVKNFSLVVRALILPFFVTAPYHLLRKVFIFGEPEVTLGESTTYGAPLNAPTNSGL